MLRGGDGQDTATYREAGAAVAASLATGSAAAGGLGRDRLVGIENLQGGAAGDDLTGDGATNWLAGLAGGDQLAGRGGADALAGGSGADRLQGDGGRDLQVGGSGGDRFDFNLVADSPWSEAGTSADLILDFAGAADRLDLATIDASTATAGNQRFTLLAEEGAAFTGAGQVRWLQGGGDTLVEASTDADRTPELQIRLAGLEDLAAADFVL